MRVRKSGNVYEVLERIYVDAAKSKAVPEGSMEAAYLYAAPGELLDEATVERLKLEVAKPTSRKKTTKE